MTLIASGIICAWPSTNASIPSGWTRETAMDAKYIQGAPAAGDADLSTSRGAATHTHTVTDHTHTQNSHTHTYSAGAGTGTQLGDALGTTESSITHTHSSATSNAATATNQNATITLDGASNDPPYVEVIWIKSDGTPTGIPVNAYAFFASDTLPTGWTRVQGNKFLKGAAASGNGGGTGGSSDAHTHSNTAHNHTQNAHSHSAKNSNGGTGTGSTSFGAGNQIPARTHVHSVSLNSATATNQAASITMSNGDAQPVFKKLNTINNGNGAADLPTNVICLWGGANASIPSGWSRFTSMDGNFHKGANADGESNVTTGGATTHGHTADPHTHIQDTHNHGSTVGAANRTRDGSYLTGDATCASAAHTHTWTIGNTVATNQNTTVTIASNTSESGYPPYVQVIFIQFLGVVAGTPLRTLMGVGT